MKFRFPGYCSLLVLFLWLLLVASAATAQDDGDDHNLIYSFSEIRSSPFNPKDNNKDYFITDDGPGLDTGCTFDTDPEHPLTIDILIDRSVGPVDADGFLVDPAPLIAKGIIPSTVTIEMPAFDIDINGTAPPERDEVAFNGETLGALTGNDGIWILNQFTVPISKVKFPAPPAPGATPIPQANRVVVTVDTLSSERWCAAIDWVQLELPIRPKVALTLKSKANNSNTIRNNNGGIIDTIYEQSADADCEITTDIGEAGDIDQYPFSGAVYPASFLFSPSNDTKIDTKIEPCPIGSLPASTEVIVKWSIAGTSLTGTETWSGLEGDVTIGMPDLVGDYEVSLDYTVDGEEVEPTVKRKLLVTKSPPLGGQIPNLRQYNLATTWASGKISDADILEGVLQGVYNYGQVFWQYAGNDVCSWDTLIGSPLPTCFTSECFSHSRVFENMAGVLGVSGMTPVEEKGANNRGFITKFTSSLDPLFTGNSRPFNSTVYDRYRFGRHSLRKHGGAYYDATFNGIYSSANEFIEWNYDIGDTTGVDVNGDLYFVTDEGAKIFEKNELAYLGWPEFTYKNPGIPLVSAVTNLAMTNPNVEIANTAIYSTLDEDSNGVYEALIANVDITIITPGTYIVRGILTKNGEVISNQPVFETQLVPQITVGDLPGVHNVVLQFSGEDIYQSGEDGPYTIEIIAFSTKGTPARKNLTTPGYTYTKFGEKSGHILTASDSVLDTDNDNRHDFLVVDVDADILNAGTYTLQGTLLKDGDTVVNASTSFILGAGQQTVALQFPGVGIFRSEQDGPYNAVITLRNQAGERQDFIEFVTQSYDHSQFEGILDITGAFSDQGIDTNANNLFDVLRVDFGVDVREAGTYQVTAALGNLVDANKVYSDAVMNLAFGAQTMTLNFSGPEINSQEMDGPYVVEISLRDPTTNKLLDKVALVQQTAAYSHLDFEPLGSVNPIILTGNSSDEGVDNNANGLFDLLKVSVELKLETADTYTWSARLVDSDGTELGFDSRSSFLNAGTASIDFFFDGQTIGQNGVAGPYQVKGLLMSGLGGANLVSSQVTTTQAYGADEFEGFVAQQQGDLDGDGDVDRDDLKLILAARNTPASGSNDPLDLDGDGMITGLDARKLILLCTRPRCAT